MAVTDRFGRLRPWLAVAGAAATAAVLLPPAGTAARHYVFAQALQYAVLAVGAPPLLVIGAPWRLGPPRLISRLAIARSGRRRTARTWLILVAFLTVALAWRLPVAVNALVTHPALTVAEAATLIVAGCALWLELAASPPLVPRPTRPQRAAFAALPMWAIWASGYIMGFSGTTWFGALAHAPGHGLGTVADQEIAAFVLFVIPGLTFVPVIYVSLLTWLRDGSDPDDEMRQVPTAAPGPLMPRPPRGWRLPS
jgi:cytochrome c oxidase assembly factor CtaG